MAFLKEPNWRIGVIEWNGLFQGLGPTLGTFLLAGFTMVQMAGKKAGLLFFVDIERQKLICVEPVNERDSAKVCSHIQRVMAAVGAELLRTDELIVYDRIVSQGRHKICLAHWRKSKCKRAYELYRQLKAEGL